MRKPTGTTKREEKKQKGLQNVSTVRPAQQLSVLHKVKMSADRRVHVIVHKNEASS